jgi:HEAT repeats
MTRKRVCALGRQWPWTILGDRRAVDGLLAALHDTDAGVRSRVAEALALIGTPEALAVVEAWKRKQGDRPDVL